MFQFLNPLVWPEGRKLELNVIKRIFLVVKKREPYLITLDSISHPSGRFCRPKVALFRPLGSALIGLDEVTKKWRSFLKSALFTLSVVYFWSFLVDPPLSLMTTHPSEKKTKESRSDSSHHSAQLYYICSDQIQISKAYVFLQYWGKL